MIAEIKNNSQHLLLSVGFLNLPPISPSIVEKAIKENPEFEDILPQTTSDRIAFSKMRDEIDGFDTLKGRLLMNKGTKEDLAKWKWLVV
jgi:hypothetical protein